MCFGPIWNRSIGMITASICSIIVRVQDSSPRNLGFKRHFNGPYLWSQNLDPTLTFSWLLFKVGDVVSWVKTNKIWWKSDVTLVWFQISFTIMVDLDPSVNSLGPKLGHFWPMATHMEWWPRWCMEQKMCQGTTHEGQVLGVIMRGAACCLLMTTTILTCMYWRSYVV